MAVLTMTRSAVKTTFVFAVWLLLPGVGSVDAEETEAVLLTAAGAAGAFTVSVNTAGPSGIEPSVQVTVPVPFTGGVVQLQPPGELSETKVVPAGVASVSVALMAGFGPLFVTVIA